MPELSNERHLPFDEPPVARARLLARPIGKNPVQLHSTKLKMKMQHQGKQPWNQCWKNKGAHERQRSDGRLQTSLQWKPYTYLYIARYTYLLLFLQKAMLHIKINLPVPLSQQKCDNNQARMQHAQKHAPIQMTVNSGSPLCPNETISPAFVHL